MTSSSAGWARSRNWSVSWGIPSCCDVPRQVEMFDSLSDRLGGVFNGMTGRGKLTKDEIEAGLREVRMALLEADVNFKVARSFVDRVRERAEQTDILESLTP